MQKVERAQEYDQDGLATETTRVTRTDEGVATGAADPAPVVASRIVWFVAGVIISLLAIRFALILLGASTASAFVNFIYTVSYPFAAPFFGMFGYTLEYGVSQFELSTLVAIAVYALIAWGIVRLLTIRNAQAVR